jgi:hypothetical protein
MSFAMQTTSYQPTPGSLAGRVLAFFDAAPEEELSSRDIATKFDVNIHLVSCSLRACVSSGLLAMDVRPSESGAPRSGHYRLGPMRPTTPRAKTAMQQPCAPTGTGAQFQQGGLALVVNEDAVWISAEGRTVQLTPQQAASAARVLGTLLTTTGASA